MNNARSRGWCFTINNYGPHVPGALNTLQGGIPNCYLIYGFEEAPTTGTPHLQCYVHFPNAKSFDRVRSLLRGATGDNGIHIERAIADALANITYCSKGGNFVELGDRPQQGKRTDLDAVVRDIVDGHSLTAVAESHPTQFIKFHGGITKLINLSQKNRDSNVQPIVVWLWGASGTGKTRFVNQWSDVYWKDPTTKWWDGYENQSIICLDDFRPHINLPFTYLLRLLDRYPLKLEVKGGYTNIQNPVIIITAPDPPDLMFHDVMRDENLRQLERRIMFTVAMPAPEEELNRVKETIENFQYF